MSTLHVRAVGDLRVPVVGTAGRFVGRARKTHEMMPDGEHVEAHTDYQRALSRGELALVVPRPAHRAAKEPS